jgi:hypothetical protein
VKLLGLVDIMDGYLLLLLVLILNSLSVLFHCLPMEHLLVKVIIPPVIHLACEKSVPLGLVDFFVHSIFFVLQLSESVLHHLLFQLPLLELQLIFKFA